MKLRTSQPRKITQNNILINKILAYSAIKINANPPLLYSTLNPETNSDSPSAKSKGVRFVSAKQEANQANAKGNVMKTNHLYSWYILKSSKQYPPTRNTKESRIKAKLTS
jgi:hypothetical protein